MDPQQHSPGVGESADPDQEHAPDRSRRKFLGAVGAASATATAVIAGASAATASTTSASVAQTQAIILRIAQVGVIFPLRLPLSGQVGYEEARTVPRLRAAQHGVSKGGGLLLANGVQPTAARQRAAEHTMPAAYLALARTAAEALIAAGLLTAGQAALIEGIGHQAATTTAPTRAALLAAVALSVRTVFPDASERTAATAAGWWLGVMEGMYRRGILGDALQRRGIR